jgi:hypothetical protein
MLLLPNKDYPIEVQTKYELSNYENIPHVLDS